MIELRKYKSKDVSSFTASHLLYEYATNKLDSSRRAVVEQAIADNPKLQSEFINIVNGMQYCDKLSETLVQDKVVEQISNQSSQINLLLERIKWDQWPLSLKWLFEATAVAVGLVVFLNLVPLTKIVHVIDSINNSDQLVEIEKRKKSVNTIDVAENKGSAEFTDEEFKDVKAPVARSADLKPDPVDKKIPNIETPDSTKPPISAAKPTAIAVAPRIEKTNLVENADIKGTGYILRAQFFITNVEMISPKIIEKIAQMGGRKAGEVEIGWLKSPKVYYFHLTIPEAKLPELQQLLAEYSPIVLKRESHPRVMPDGIVRLLFTLEESASNE